jgi:DNA modification methylase
LRANTLDLFQKYSGVIPSTSYLTHSIHSYTAKAIPHLPRFFIEEFTKKGEVIFDPFCGSGTSLLEAKVLNRNAVGIDIHPLSTMISEVKTTPIDALELKSVIDKIKKETNNHLEVNPTQFWNIDYWFSKEAQIELSKIKSVLDNEQPFLDDKTNKFLKVCFSSIIRKTSYADPRMAKTYKSKRILKKATSGLIPKPIKLFESALDRNYERLKAFSALSVNDTYVKVFQGDARSSTSILEKNCIQSVDAVVTSPPYINAQDYFRSYKLEVSWLGLCSPVESLEYKKQSIGTELGFGGVPDKAPTSNNRLLNNVLSKIWSSPKKQNKAKTQMVFKYFNDMEKVIKEINSLLVDNGHLCLIMGNNKICEINIPSFQILSEIVEKNGFVLIAKYRDKIRNRALPPNRRHNGGIIKEEWITVFRKK